MNKVLQVQYDWSSADYTLNQAIIELEDEEDNTEVDYQIVNQEKVIFILFQTQKVS